MSRKCSSQETALVKSILYSQILFFMKNFQTRKLKMGEAKSSICLKLVKNPVKGHLRLGSVVALSSSGACGAITGGGTLIFVPHGT